MTSDINDTYALNDGHKMQRFGLGVYLVNDGSEIENSIRWAFEAGYRLIDTAWFYQNEVGVGKAVRESGLPRKDVFITTKLWNSDHGYDSGLRACEKSLKNLNTDYIDLYLIHWPGLNQQKRLQTWEAMLKLKEQQKVLSVGVSNFEPYHIDELIAEFGVAPAANQIELHPLLSQLELRKYCAEKNIAITCWGPLFHGHLKEVPEVNAVGDKYGKTGAQAVLRWHLQNNLCIIPKSVKKHRIIENADIFDFELSQEDMTLIDNINQNKRFGAHPDKLDFGFID